MSETENLKKISKKPHKEPEGAGRTEKARGSAGNLETGTTKASGTDRY